MIFQPIFSVLGHSKIYTWHDCTLWYNTGMADALHLVLKHYWFDKIISGEKTSEYRECRDYWNRRLGNKHYDVVVFHQGYTNNTATYKIVSIGITTAKNDLGVDKCWEIKLGRKITTN